MRNVCFLALLVISQASLTPPPCPHHCVCQAALASISCRDVPFRDLRDQLTSQPEVKTLVLEAVPVGELTETSLAPLAASLTHLTWRHSQLQALSGQLLATLVQAEVIDLSGNLIQSIADDAFANNMNLKHLNLSHNQIRNIQPRAFDNLDQLGVLDLNHNQLELTEQVFSPLWNLEQLDLSYNKISTLANYYFLPNKRLTQLDLNHNELVEISKQALVNLNILLRLDVSHNSLISLPPHLFHNLEQLEFLNISHNALSSVINDTFVPLTNLKYLDLSANALTHLSDTSFSENKKLRVLRLDNTQISTIKTELLASLTELVQLSVSHNPRLVSLDSEVFYHKPKLRVIDLGHNALTRLPPSLTTLNLSSLDMSGNAWTCDCHMAWYAEWWSQNKHNIVPSKHGLFCTKTIYPDLVHSALIPTLRGLNCTPAEILHATATTYFLPAHNITLDCVVSGEPTPTITWLTPQGWTFHWVPEYSVSPTFKHHPVVHDVHMNPVHQSHLFLLHNGSLLISHFNRQDRGNYSCFISNPFSNASRLVPVKMDPIIIYYAKMESIAFGTLCAFLFLLMTLLVQLIIHLCKGCCQRDSQPKQIQSVLDNLDQVRAQQLTRLQENYALQVAKIKENYEFQSEKIRESYKDQVENLKTIKRNGTTHLVSLREQYSDQMLRVRDYSTGQLNWVRENYVFQRNRVRKFSAHQMIRIRQNYKYQQQALNKMLESLPTLETCKSSCGYSMSTVYDESELPGLSARRGHREAELPLGPLPLGEAESLASLYFTPPGQLSPQQIMPAARAHGGRSAAYTKLSPVAADAKFGLAGLESRFCPVVPDGKFGLGVESRFCPVVPDGKFGLAGLESRFCPVTKGCDGMVASTSKAGPSYSMTGGPLYVAPVHAHAEYKGNASSADTKM